ncbi:type II secretion system F family protein [bacterium]|jgi:tight adherence protein B|nr:type II secretion system F family protein [bacterium]
MSLPIIISIVAALGVMCLVAAVANFWRDYSGTKSLDDRLGRLAGTSVQATDAPSLLRDPMRESTDSFMDALLPRLPSLKKLFQQADFRMDPAKFWLITAGVGIGAALLPALIGLPFYVPILTGLIASTCPILYVMHLRNKRLSKFGTQLGEALELVARALRAGHSVAAAMQSVADEMPSPIASEFGRVYEEQNLGVSLDLALRNLSERIPNLDLKFFVTAVCIQRQTGGDLAEILDKIGYVIRERFKIMGMVQALTGEGRISGVVLIGLPFFLLLIMMYLSPAYVSLLWTDPRGRTMSGMGCLSMLIGAIAIRKIVNIKI